jgi:hypothetical protein
MARLRHGDDFASVSKMEPFKRLVAYWNVFALKETCLAREKSRGTQVILKIFFVRAPWRQNLYQGIYYGAREGIVSKISKSHPYNCFTISLFGAKPAFPSQARAIYGRYRLYIMENWNSITG